MSQRNNTVRNCFLLLIGALFLGACAFPVPPQSREEFRAYAERGDGWRIESFVIDRSYPQVVDHLERKTAKCFNAVVTRTVTTGMNVSTGSTTYRSSVRRDARNHRAELTVQKIDTPRTLGPNMPAGGFYLLGADVSAVSSGKTRVKLYRPQLPVVGGFGFGVMADAVRDWSSGKDTTCPKLP
jgi:hypothetical protein